jgi:hypothetical protein
MRSRETARSKVNMAIVRMGPRRVILGTAGEENGERSKARVRLGLRCLAENGCYLGAAAQFRGLDAIRVLGLRLGVFR